MDIELPGMSEIEATRLIVTAHPDVHVVVVSMHADRHFVEGAKLAGAMGYVLKDMLGTELHEAVRAVVGGGSSFIVHDNSA
jgi:DNA-binding NarL/FixJ family response regulator